MKLTHQAYFSRFLEVVVKHGRSRVVYKGENRRTLSCDYGAGKHPGCGIGCQRGFRKAFCRLQGRIQLRRVEWLSRHYPAEMFQIFGVMSCEDDAFLGALQTLHDLSRYWVRGRALRRNAVLRFAKEWNLKVPERAQDMWK